MAKITKEDIIKALGEMSCVEACELAKAIQEHFGIEGMPTMAAGAAASGDAGSEEASEFDVKITTVESKMSVIKFIKSYANVGLADAKNYVEDCANKTIGELMNGKIFSKADAAKLIADLKENGAVAEMVAK